MKFFFALIFLTPSITFAEIYHFSNTLPSGNGVPTISGYLERAGDDVSIFLSVDNHIVETGSYPVDQVEHSDFQITYSSTVQSENFYYSDWGYDYSYEELYDKTWINGYTAVENIEQRVYISSAPLVAEPGTVTIDMPELVLYQSSYICEYYYGDSSQTGTPTGGCHDEVNINNGLDGLTFDLVLAYHIDGPITEQQWIETHSVTLSAIPVPAAAWFFGSALIGLAGIKRKQSR
ncbi:VPLPA-CTERM sorting domain-containing protein [Oceanicoccus sp. KOV_DT_Chl]|uniref:VPLPA-CTERM sorting domain-containing protein n=1 Tax=Oceanicoccus sp. KOV_DT_Chl TaxID=1904639 RepID=UPI000C7BFE1E|nr:VPLPA-CTERM sorting domain-containing protein [Oceanicoccus sp. KOV_DT_Chl]